MGAGAGAGAVVGVKGRIDCGKRWIIHGIRTVVPVRTAKRTDGQVHLHLVIENPITAEHLHFAIFEDVPCKPKARSNLVLPTEVDWIDWHASRLNLAREQFLLNADTKIEGEPLPMVHESCAKMEWS